VTVTRIGEALPLSSRRVVSYFGESASYKTPIGQIDGVADGVILVRDAEHELHRELSPAEAREVARALQHAATAVEQWQEHASGFNTIRVFRSPDGALTVEHRGRARPMRLSKLRGSIFADGSRHFLRHCWNCRKGSSALYVASDDVRSDGSYRDRHAEVCEACVEKLEAATRTDVAALVDGRR
jgi:hypothetical protein